MDKVYLFGPFFGEASWEYFRFAPYMIYLKKNNPDIKAVVLTRISRFDFYGKYATILVPLNIQDDCNYKQIAFRLSGFDDLMAKKICVFFRKKYEEKFEIFNHFFPDFSLLRYNLKWQFPRSKMIYDFQPRESNFVLMNKLYPENNIIILDEKIDYENKNYKVITTDIFMKSIIESTNTQNIYYGCLIELIKRCKFVVSNIESDVGKLSLLLNKPLIYLNRKVSSDTISLLNPLKTKIIDCENIEDGVRKYENSF